MSRSEPRTPGNLPALLAAVASGLTVQDAARAAGMSKATATRRLADPAVRAQLDQLRTEVLERVADRLTGLTLAAADTLADLMGDAGVPPA